MLPLFVSKPDDNDDSTKKTRTITARKGGGGGGSLFRFESPIMVNQTQGDLLLLENALYGKLITSKVFPLVWTAAHQNQNNDNDDDNDKSSPPPFRGLDYLQSLTKDKVQQLSQEEIVQIGVSLRDLIYLQLQGGHASDDQQDIIQRVSDSLDTDDDDDKGGGVTPFVYNKFGLLVMPWPTRRYKMMRWVQAPVEQPLDDPWVDELFLRVAAGSAGDTDTNNNSNNDLIMAFCDPEDLAFHNVENVIPLDDMLFTKNNLPPLQVHHKKELVNTRNKEIISFKVRPTQAFDPLVHWKSFVPPFYNQNQRGGKRFIFRSAHLAARLKQAIQASDIRLPFDDDGYYVYRENDDEQDFLVNEVFRLNKFEPSDDMFHAHYDVPFYDSIQNRRSKYTLLLYLTPGSRQQEAKDGRGGGIGVTATGKFTVLDYLDVKQEVIAPSTAASGAGKDGGAQGGGGGGGGVLRIGDDVVLDHFQALDGIIFSQQYEHEGRPYSHGPKIFLRTELIFPCAIHRRPRDYDSQVARIFNMACYNSLFHPELSEYATRLFNFSVATRFQVNAKFGHEDDDDDDDNDNKVKYKYHYQCLMGRSYITNGHDYWFPLGMTTLHDAALISIMDYFHASYGLKKFKELLSESREDIFRNDNDKNNNEVDDARIFRFLWDNIDSENAATARQIIHPQEHFGYGCFDNLPPSQCNCNMECDCGSKKCRCGTSDTQHPGNVEEFNEVASELREQINPFSVTIFDGSIRINTEDMEIIEGKEIRFKTTGYQERVNFASCFDHAFCRDEYTNDVVSPTKQARMFHLPPIQYQEIEGEGYHLIVDMFDNGWVDRQVDIPVFEHRVGRDVPRTTDDDDRDPRARMDTDEVGYFE